MIESSTAITWGGVVAACFLLGAVWKVVSYGRAHVAEAVEKQERQFKETLEAQKAQFKEALDVIHKRIDRANDETKQIRSEYVRREDLDRHLNTIDKKLDGLGAGLDDLKEFMMKRPAS